MAVRTPQVTMLTLIQCGETDWDRERRILGSADLPLAASGRAHVVEACEKLLPVKIAQVYHAGDESAAETASIAARIAGGRARTEPDLHDPQLGMLEGITRQDFQERFHSRFRQWNDDPINLVPPEGEPIVDARARLFASIAKLAKRNRGGEFGVVMHCFGIALVRAWLAGVGSNEVWSTLRNRPLIERYPMHDSLVEQLIESASLQTAGL